MNEKRPIPEVVDEKRYLHQPQLLVWVSFYSSTTTGIGLFLFTNNLWYRSLFIHPQPLV
jgi:hypothetical protein